MHPFKDAHGIYVRQGIQESGVCEETAFIRLRALAVVMPDSAGTGTLLSVPVPVAICFPCMIFETKPSGAAMFFGLLKNFYKNILTNFYVSHII